MPGRQTIPSDRIWSKVGYSRAVRVGDLIEVAGTSPSGPDGVIMHPGDLYQQTKYVCDVILKAVRDLGGQDGDVVRTRVFVTDISRWEEAGKAHGEAFGANPPASAFYEVSALLHPELMIEIEATAIVGSGD
jgi:enamine deaminase RidA (YjgF/YER057c/UK114 family)